MRHCVRPEKNTSLIHFLLQLKSCLVTTTPPSCLGEVSFWKQRKQTEYLWAVLEGMPRMSFFFFYCDLSGEVWLFMKETGQNFSSSSQRIWYQQPVTSTLQLKELRCKEPSLSALSEGHQRLRWSESAAALMVWVSPLSLQKNLFVLRMFTDPGEDKQPVSCL